MKYSITHRINPYLWGRNLLSLWAASIMIFSVMALGLISANAQTITPDDIKIVTVQVDGEERVAPTRAKTVAQLLKRMEIEIKPADQVSHSLDTEIIQKDLVITITRARPYSVEYDGEVRRIWSAYIQPEDIIKDAGFELHPKDDISWTEANQFSLLQIGKSIKVTPAKQFIVNVYGTDVVVYSQQGTVSGVLQDANIPVEPEDTLSKQLSEFITDGDTVYISRLGTQIVTELVPINFETQVTKDANKNVGDNTVVSAGINGEKQVTYEVALTNGVETGRTVIKEVQVSAATPQVEVRGTNTPAPTSTNVAGDKQLIMAQAGIPESDWSYVDYIITKESGWRHLVYNGSGSGAYGLCQSLPGSKMASAGSDWKTNPVTQLRWCSGYATSRYGGWAGAYSFWIANHWW